MKLFKIPDNGKSDLPIVETHYYNWLKCKNEKDIHSINTKREYLTDLGFIVGVNHLTDKNISLLKIIEQMYFEWECKNKTLAK